MCTNALHLYYFAAKKMTTNMDDVYEAQCDKEDNGVVRGMEKEGYEAIDDDELGLNDLDLKAKSVLSLEPSMFTAHLAPQ